MGTTLRPISSNPDGLGAFVRLDYSTNFEHAVVFLAKEWDSLAHFIYAPGVFIERWRSTYGGGTPKHMHLKFPSPIWELEGPVTFIIEPITVPTPSNAQILGGLGPLYKGLAAIAKAWSDQTPTDFRKNVMTALQTPEGWDLGGEDSTGTSPFPFEYVAEFAIKTRTITIKYIPRTKDRQFYYHQTITPMTLNRVRLTNINFIHFDIYFPESLHDRHNIAFERATFALDYLTDPQFINKLGQIPNTPAKAHESKAPFYANQSALGLTDPDPDTMDIPMIYGEGGSKGEGPFQPRLVIDSVWPDPSNMNYGNHDLEIDEYKSQKVKWELPEKNKLDHHKLFRTATQSQTSPPPWETQLPQLCVLLHTLQATNEAGIYIDGEYITMEALIKAYTAPQP